MTAATATAPKPKTTKTTKAKATTDAKPAPRVDRYADAATSRRIADGLKAARDAGFSRATLRELTELGGSALWRSEKGRVHRAEVRALTEALARIASGDVKPPARRAGTSRRAQAVSALEAALTEKTVGGTRKLVAEALDLLKS